MAEDRKARPNGPVKTDADVPAGTSDTTPQENVRARAAERRRTLRRATLLVLALAASGFSVRAFVGKQGLLEAHRSAAELARLEAEVERWQARNDALEGRIKALRDDPAVIERTARERLGWAKPGEVTILFPHDPSAPEPGDPPPASPEEFSPAIGDGTDATATEDTGQTPPVGQPAPQQQTPQRKP